MMTSWFLLTILGERDRAAAKSVCENLLGPKSVEDEKTVHTSESNPHIDMIGYTLNLETEVVTISRRNMLKALYAFTSVGIER